MVYCRIVLLCVLAGLCGCSMPASDAGLGAAPPMTLSDFYGFCSSLETPTQCFSDPICKRYREELKSAPSQRAACLAMCRRTDSALFVGNLVNGCEGVLDRAEALCEQFCQRHDASGS